MSDDIIGTIRTVGLGIVGIAIVVVLLSTMAPWLMGLVGGDAVWNPQAGAAETLANADDRPSGLTVQPSAGNAIQFDTSTAYLEAPTGVPAGNWSVCTVASLDGGTPTAATVDVVALENETVTLRWADGAWRARYQPENVTASVADGDPASLTPMCAVWDGALTLETPDGATTSQPGESVSRRVAVGLEGRLDETRVINASLSAGERDTYLNDPVAPLNGSEHALRLMYNEGSSSSVKGYYASADATLVGAVSWTTGVAVPTLQEGVDYAVSVSPLEVTPLADGYLDGAPYAQASWDASGFGGLVARLFSVGGAALSLLAVGLVVLAARVAMDEFGGGGF